MAFLFALLLVLAVVALTFAFTPSVRTAPSAVKPISKRLYSDEEWEQKLLNIIGYDFDKDYVNPPRAHRYIKQADGSVYNLYGRWYYSADLWQRYVKERRHPDANHNFRWAGTMTDHIDQTGRNWPTSGVVCARCGESRDIYAPAISLDRINKDGWCKA